MKNIQRKINKFQEIYASRIVDLIFFIAAIELFVIGMVYGGTR